MSRIVTPELKVKREISQYILLAKKDVFFWWQKSVGVFDPRTMSFRKNKSRFEINGVSDILGVYRGKFFAIEVKSKNGKPTKEQIEFLENVKRHGGYACVARSVDDVVKLFDEIEGKNA